MYFYISVSETSPITKGLAHDIGHHADGVVSISEREPKVGVPVQPRAGGHNRFGIVDFALSGRSSQHLVVENPPLSG